MAHAYHLNEDVHIAVKDHKGAQIVEGLGSATSLSSAEPHEHQDGGDGETKQAKRRALKAEIGVRFPLGAPPPRIAAEIILFFAPKLSHRKKVGHFLFAV
jgi:hypothetical protein